MEVCPRSRFADMAAELTPTPRLPVRFHELCAFGKENSIGTIVLVVQLTGTDWGRAVRQH